MTGTLTLGAAFLLGLAASGHCMVMCGGISAALGLATATRSDGRPRAALLVAYQLGRTLAYVIVAALLGGALGVFVGWLDIDAVRTALRVVSAVALCAAALVAFGATRDAGSWIGRLVWPRLAPIGRSLLPVTSVSRAIAFGMVWGFMPCGFVYTVLVIAALSLDALHAAGTMLAFGLGTAPAMVAVAFGARRASRLAGGVRGKRIAGAFLMTSAVLTLFAPQIVAAAPWLHPWMPYLCAVNPGR